MDPLPWVRYNGINDFSPHLRTNTLPVSGSVCVFIVGLHDVEFPTFFRVLHCCMVKIT